MENLTANHHRFLKLMKLQNHRHSADHLRWLGINKENETCYWFLIHLRFLQCLVMILRGKHIKPFYSLGISVIYLACWVNFRFIRYQKIKMRTFLQVFIFVISSSHWQTGNNKIVIVWDFPENIWRPGLTGFLFKIGSPQGSRNLLYLMTEKWRREDCI